jgi:hypothetical protein
MQSSVGRRFGLEDPEHRQRHTTRLRNGGTPPCRRHCMQLLCSGSFARNCTGKLKLIARERSALGAMQSARVHSVARARPAAFPQHVKGLGSLARSSLSNHDQAQLMVVRKPQLGEAISTVDSRENVVPPSLPPMRGTPVSCPG